METLEGYLDDPRFDRNTIRYFMQQSSTNITPDTTNRMLSIAQRIAHEKPQLCGGLLSQQRKISRFVKDVLYNIYETHQSSARNTLIALDDVRFQSHTLPYKYVVSNKIHLIEQEESLLTEQLKGMLTQRQRELYIANHELDMLNSAAIPHHYDIYLKWRRQLATNQMAAAAAAATTEGSTIPQPTSGLASRFTLGSVGGGFIESFITETGASGSGIGIVGSDEVIVPPNDNPIFEYFLNVSTI